MEKLEKGENVNINFTIYSIQDDIIAKVINTLDEVIEEELQYNIGNLTYGKHRNAEREHTHVHMSCVRPPGVKVYKVLNEKIKRSKKYQELNNQYEMKITFRYQHTDIGKIYKTQYDEWNSLAYPLKEYEKKDYMAKDLGDIDLEIKDKLLIMKQNTNWEAYREYAHQLYKTQLKIREREIEKKDKKETDMEKLYDYLGSNIKQGTGEIIDEIETKVLIHLTIRHMLFWYRKHDKRFNVNSMKNVAINYLYKRQNIDETNIINYLKI